MFAIIVLRLGSAMLRTFRSLIFLNESALLLPLALALSTIALGLIAVAALRSRSSEI
jgi:hypothetical protein